MKIVGASSEINPLGAGVEDQHLQPDRDLLRAQSSSSLYSQYSTASSSCTSACPPVTSSVNGDYTVKISGQSSDNQIVPSSSGEINKTVDFEIKVEYVDRSCTASPASSTLSSLAPSAASSQTDLLSTPLSISDEKEELYPRTSSSLSHATSSKSGHHDRKPIFPGWQKLRKPKGSRLKLQQFLH